MSFLPDIDEHGRIKPVLNPKKLYTPPARNNLLKEEVRFAELNNFDRDFVTEDFSDSPHLNK